MSTARTGVVDRRSREKGTSMSESKRLWRDLEERDAAAAATAEFERPDAAEAARLRPSRRDFLRAAGFTFAVNAA